MKKQKGSAEDIDPIEEDEITFNLKPKKKKSQDENYVDPKVFFEEIKKYYKTNEISDFLSDSVCKIAHGLSFAPNFINYSYKDEMVGDAILKMYAALKHKKFSVTATDDKGNFHNPFSYFTTIAFHAFVTRIKKEKRHRTTITEYQERYFPELLRSDEMGAKNIYIDDSIQHEE